MKKNKKVGVKFDSGKGRISLLQGYAIEQVIKVGEFGAKKYGNDNYRNGMPVSKYLNAAFRHAFLEWLFKGNNLDIDLNCKGCQKNKCNNHSGLNHLAHAAWNLLSALEQMILKPEFDDRYRKSVKKGKK